MTSMAYHLAGGAGGASAVSFRSEPMSDVAAPFPLCIAALREREIGGHSGSQLVLGAASSVTEKNPTVGQHSKRGRCNPFHSPLTEPCWMTRYLHHDKASADCCTATSSHFLRESSSGPNSARPTIKTVSRLDLVPRPRNGSFLFRHPHAASGGSMTPAYGIRTICTPYLHVWGRMLSVTMGQDLPAFEPVVRSRLYRRAGAPGNKRADALESQDGTTTAPLVTPSFNPVLPSGSYFRTEESVVHIAHCCPERILPFVLPLSRLIPLQDEHPRR